MKIKHKLERDIIHLRGAGSPACVAKAEALQALHGKLAKAEDDYHAKKFAFHESEKALNLIQAEVEFIKRSS